ncbi:kinetochore protein Nuf2 [Galdieria sulphuraria]|uniref:Kinetochore protein Nuf2 n=1 Tax=Galdieria sulphuraria TaxID=130081 RepID=M2Y9U9_GALSU|nr:kinetochore protein Nuf2 [Galdieria sulphuraria]EME32654.1 kinetochore protein Nuf2 [Galdieria sulphuraria]|eukprot:XP_005709174.1 kinetochore protein Nuf2 [Galdieria sulphuraria]
MYTPSKSPKVKGPQYSFPILNAEEIVQCLKELQIPFSEEQLKKPTSEGIRATYEQILELLLGISRDELQQPVFQALDVLSYPELHEYSVGQLNFHRNLQKLLEACGYHEFSMKDYLKPEYARTKKILSAIINFAKFREERLVTFLELQGRSEEITTRKQQTEEELNELREKVKKLRCEDEEMAPYAQSLQEQAEELVGDIAQYNKSQASLQKQIKEMKAEVASRSDKISSTKFNILNEKQECNKLQEMVVPSPEKAKKEIEDMSEQLENDKQTTQSIERRTKDLKLRISGLEDCERELRQTFKLMQECEEQMNEWRILQDGLSEKRQRIVDYEEELKRLKSSESHYRRQLSNVEERISRLQMQAEEKKRYADESYDQVCQDRSEVNREREEVERRIDRTNVLIQTTKDKIQEMLNEHEREVDKVREKYRTLEASVVKYHRELFSVMQSLSSYQGKFEVSTNW